MIPFGPRAGRLTSKLSINGTNKRSRNYTHYSVENSRPGREGKVKFETALSPSVRWEAENSTLSDTIRAPARESISLVPEPVFPGDVPTVPRVTQFFCLTVAFFKRYSVKRI